jgi:hypothetical protein
VFGDEHVRFDEPFYSAKQDYFEWVVQQEFNNHSNIAIQVGDLFHSSHPTPREYDLVHWFLQRLNFSKVLILSGNGIHEYNRVKETHAIEPLSRIENVEIITQPHESQFGNLKVLFLPWVPSRYYNDMTMKEWYESSPKGEYDYIFGHFAHKEFFGTEIDISHLQGKRRMGHVHVPDGEYVGVNTITRADEKGIECNLNIIDMEDGKEELFPIPRFIDYYTVEYPNDAPEVEAYYPIWTITNAPSKEKAEQRYGNIYIKDITVDNKNISKNSNNTNIIEEKQSVNEYLDSFVKDYSIKKGIENKLRSVIT